MPGIAILGGLHEGQPRKRYKAWNNRTVRGGDGKAST